MDSREVDRSDEVEARVAAWVREVAQLDDTTLVQVRERACSRSGWPPFEVVITHGPRGHAHEHHVHKRLAFVTRLDVIGAWRGRDACCDG